MKNFLSEVVAAAKSGDLVVLAGAGISVPSHLPTGIRLAQEYVKALASYKDTPPEFVDDLINKMQEGEKSLRPEVVMWCIQQEYGPLTLEPLRSFLKAGPNHYHYYMAHLISYGCSIITTNFDTLIEDACRSFNVTPDIILYDSDYERIAQQDSDLSELIVKLHGSLRDSEGNDASQTIATTVEDLADGLSPMKAHLLQRLLAKHDLLVLGYSGLDEFDILPVLMTSQSNRVATWLEHRRSQPIRAVYQPNDLASRAQDHIDRFLKTHAQGSRLRGSTDRFVRAMSVELGMTFRESIAPPPVLWQSEFKMWSDKVSTRPSYKRFVALGKVYEGAENLSRAIDFYQRALKVSDGAKKLEVLLLLGNAYLLDEDYRLAKKYSERALRMARRDGDEAKRVKALHGLGRVAWRTDDYRGAEQRFREALEIAEALGDTAGIAAQLNSLGNICWMQGDWERAKEFYERGFSAIEGKRGANYRTYFRLCNNLSLSLHRLRTDLERAEELVDEAIEGYKTIGDDRNRADCYGTKAGILRLRGKIEDAYEMQHAALSILTGLGLETPVAVTRNNIALLEIYRGNLSEAENLLQASWRYFNKCGDSSSLAETAFLIARAHQAEGNPKHAIEWYTKSVGHADEVGLPGLVARGLAHLAEAYFEAGEIPKASQVVERATDIAGQVGDELVLAGLWRIRALLELQNRGPVQVVRNYLKTAEEHLKKEPDLVEEGYLELSWAKLFLATGKEATGEAKSRHAAALFEEAGFYPGIQDTRSLMS